LQQLKELTLLDDIQHQGINMDSITVDFSIKKGIGKKLLETLPIVNNVRRDTDEIKSEYLVAENGVSPLTNAKFSVKAIKDETGEHNLDFCGYRISLNIPACTIGNNILLVNDWYHSHRIALLLLQHWLLVKGCHQDSIHAFDLDHAETYKATPTFLIPFASAEDAVAAQKALYEHAEGIYNFQFRAKPLATDAVYMSGSKRRFTWYLEKQKTPLLRCYHKSGRIPKGFYDFGGDAELEAMLFSFGARHLRVEGDFAKTWLRKNNLLKLQESIDEDLLFDTMWSSIRKLLWADFEFRLRNFKAEDLPKAGSKDRVLLEHYLEDGDVRQHPLVQDSYHPDKYFHDVNQRGRANYRVDYRIPWSIRKSMLCKDASLFLNTELPFVPPADLANHIYGPHTAPSIIELLQSNIDTLIVSAKKRRAAHFTPRRHSHAAPKRNCASEDTSDISDLMG
jgi:hypothetical protein